MKPTEERCTRAWTVEASRSRIAACVVLTALCGCGAAPRIPMAVTDEEYSVYAAWVRHHFRNEPPPRLLMAERTFIFDPRDRCHTRELSASMARALHDLGQAEFPVEAAKFDRPLSRIPWKFEGVDGFPRENTPPYALIAFSRVAFNRGKTKGLFAVSNSCGGLCGGGGGLIATRAGGEWTFQALDACMWVY